MLNYKTQIIILLIIIIGLAAGLGFLFYNWQHKTILNFPQPFFQPEQNQAITQKGAEIKTLAYCELFKSVADGQYDNCLLNLAFSDKNADYCQLITDETIKKNCASRFLYDQAVAQNSLAACFVLEDKILSDSCLSQVIGQAANQETICQTLSKQSEIDYCQAFIERIANLNNI